VIVIAGDRRLVLVRLTPSESVDHRSGFDADGADILEIATN